MNTTPEPSPPSRKGHSHKSKRRGGCSSLASGPPGGPPLIRSQAPSRTACRRDPSNYQLARVCLNHTRKPSSVSWGSVKPHHALALSARTIHVQRTHYTSHLSACSDGQSTDGSIWPAHTHEHTHGHIHGHIRMHATRRAHPRVLKSAQSRALDRSDRQRQVWIAGLILKSSRAMLRDHTVHGPPGLANFRGGPAVRAWCCISLRSQASSLYIRWAVSCRSQVSFPGEPVRST